MHDVPDIWNSCVSFRLDHEHFHFPISRRKRTQFRYKCKHHHHVVGHLSSRQRKCLCWRRCKTLKGGNQVRIIKKRGKRLKIALLRQNGSFWQWQIFERFWGKFRVKMEKSSTKGWHTVLKGQGLFSIFGCLGFLYNLVPYIWQGKISFIGDP